jgi:septum formation protein
MIAQRDHTVNATLLLASASPRRRELIKLLGLPVETTSADIDETPLDHEAAPDMARRLSCEKAQSIASSLRCAQGRLFRLHTALQPRSGCKCPSSLIIIASDTTVALEGEPLGKPLDAADARSMLRRLRDRVHQVHTAITLIDAALDQAITDLATSDVQMRAYSDRELDDYIAGGDPFDKAGAYAIQHNGFHPAENFTHCFANVMGLPLCHVTRSLRNLGIKPLNDVPTVCQAHLNYPCPVFQSILTSDK